MVWIDYAIQKKYHAVMNANTIDRFWRKVRKTESCWLWIGSKRNKGYGAFVWSTSAGDIIQGRAHRFAWEMAFGPVPSGLCVLHTCDNPSCVRPEHLWIGTKSDNNRDMLTKGRRVLGGSKTGIAYCKYEKGEQHHNARITPEIVKSIRETHARGGISLGTISRQHGMSVSHIFRIVNRKAWKHVP